MASTDEKEGNASLGGSLFSSGSSGSGGSGGGGGGGGSGVLTLPGWLSALRPLAERIQKHGLRGAIRAIVAVWIVGGIVNVFTEFLAILLEAGTAIGSALNAGIASLGAAGGGIGGAVLGLATEINAALLGTASALGPFGIVFLMVAYVGIAVGLVRLGIWLIELIDVPFVDLGAIRRGVTLPFRWLWGVVR